MIVKCEWCGKEFDRAPSKVNKPKNPFCSQECYNKYQTDEFTPFRKFIIRAQVSAEKKGVPIDIDVEYIKLLYEQQNGLCKYTNWEIPLCQDKNNYKRASLDRVIPESGYTRGNLAWTTIMANHAKNIWPEENLIEFCEAVASKYRLKSSEETLTIPPSGL
jgi:hypothetical protein